MGPLNAVHKSNISLLEFARAGNATATFFESTNILASQRYCTTDHVLEDDIRFAGYNYVWETISYKIYLVSWKDRFVLSEMFYVISQSPAHNKALLEAAGKWTSELHEEVLVFDDGVWNKDKDLHQSVQQCSWDDVVLNTATKTSLQAEVGFFDNEEKYKSFDLPWKRGIILCGPPGNGKTATIKAIIMDLYKRQIPSLYVKSFATSARTGLSENDSIRRVFQKAREHAPCLLVLEDLDSLVGATARSYFLNEVDGLQSNDGIFIIASANDPAKLDPAIVNRPSRFDRKYPFLMPDKTERNEYFRSLGRRVQAKNVTWSNELCAELAGMTDGFSFAYLKELFRSAMVEVLHKKNELNECRLLGNGPPHVDGRLFSTFQSQIELLKVQMTADNVKQISSVKMISLMSS